MKLLLCSSDYENVEIMEKLKTLLDKPLNQSSVVVINEASAVESGDKRWLISGLQLLADTCGEVDFVNLLALDLERVLEKLNSADIIFCFGGNTNYLKMVFDNTGLSDILPKILEKKIWVGSSAGSCVMGIKKPHELHSYLYGEDDEYLVDRFLEYVPFCIVPHYQSDFMKKDAIEKIIETSKYINCPIYAISDNAAILVTDENIELVGSNACKIVDGEIIENC